MCHSVFELCRSGVCDEDGIRCNPDFQSVVRCCLLVDYDYKYRGMLDG